MSDRPAAQSADEVAQDVNLGIALGGFLSALAGLGVLLLGELVFGTLLIGIGAAITIAGAMRNRRVAQEVRDD